LKDIPPTITIIFIVGLNPYMHNDNQTLFIVLKFLPQSANKVSIKL